jgi:hypothetical protein
MANHKRNSLNDLIRINGLHRLFFILICHLAGISHSCGNSHFWKNIYLQQHINANK